MRERLARKFNIRLFLLGCLTVGLVIVLFEVVKGLSNNVYASLSQHAKVNEGQSQQRGSGNFDQFTMRQMVRDFRKMGVHQGKYLLTGGLGVSNPKVDSVDSNGGLILQTNNTGFVFTLDQSVSNPSTWMVQNQSLNSVSVAKQGSSGIRIPWVRKTVDSGRAYYEWVALPGYTWFYFKENSTYMFLRVSSSGVNKYPFPQGIMNHLILYKWSS